MKNFFKLTTLFIITLFFFENCEKNDGTIIEGNFNLEQKTLKTVPLKEAKSFFNEQLSNKKNYNAKTESTLQLDPLWETLQHEDLYEINQAKLTTSNVLVSKNGNFESKLFFINVDGEMHQAIYTIYKEKVDQNGYVTDALVFLNEIDGTFIDGYRVENGLFTEQFVVKENKEAQKAGFLLLLLQDDDAPLPTDCWNTGSLAAGGGSIGSITITRRLAPEVHFINNWNVSFSNGNGLNQSPGAGSGYSSVMGSVYATKVENKGLETIDVNEEDGPSCKSFNFKNISSNWQEASVRNIKFNIFVFEIINGVKVRKRHIITFPQPVKFGMQRRFANGTNIPSGLASEIGAKSIRDAIDDIVSKYFNLVVNSTTIISNQFQENLKNEFRQSSNGGRVNFNSMTSSSSTQYVTYGVIPDNCY